jgi:hypothetical protein
MNPSNPHVYACEDVRGIQRLHADLLTGEPRRRPIREQLDRQARRILEAYRRGDRSVVPHFRCWHPKLVARDPEEIMARDCTLDDARDTIAREHGFADWPDVEERGSEPPDTDFEAAIDAVLSGDAAALRSLLERRPSLVHDRSGFGHRATLLHYVGSNGVETHRQVVPRNLAEIARVLLDAGADVNATAGMYGGSSTTIALLTTSDHPARAGVVDEVVEVLLAAGAKTS